MSEEEERSKVVRRGPFYAPRPLTEKEKKERDLKRKANRKLLEKMLDDGSYDKATRFVAIIISYVSFPLAKFYLWHSQMFNFMIVGATGMVLSWLLYEGLFRPIFIGGGGIGTFIGMVATTICVFMWNYMWNKAWSLNAFAQLNTMKRAKLLEMQEKIEEILCKREVSNRRGNSDEIGRRVREQPERERQLRH